ncbi:folylpolyglutamate synthase, mitochondrial-like [Orussus abietinus]|uniref:folylpolyglutamate synthase, mitochondrial-like n=1 Tax=Orussus abietinus TaxID=222816 RepID=UPI000626C9E8|nr:folylpolyglutamate synthase, mitochondrial-like [Orussus abietinus]
MLSLMKMMTSVGSQHAFYTTPSYKETVQVLNSLQSNASYIQKFNKAQVSPLTKLQDMDKLLLRSGITPKELDSLSVIHVAGTKGKGSTCAFTEAILRRHGFNTGFYSSPHLISVRERIRINGEPLNEFLFTKFFWKVYNELYSKKDNEEDMPPYFKFLTVLMFHVFVETNVDVAIIEVGIGGEYDCTNVVRNPVCVGITSLGLDHTKMLGDTLESIAYEKSGIFKPNTQAFTVPQPENAMKILVNRAIERNCKLNVVRSLENYPWKNELPNLGISCDVQKYNAALAIEMAQTWIRHINKNKSLLNSNVHLEVRNTSRSNTDTFYELNANQVIKIDPTYHNFAEHSIKTIQNVENLTYHTIRDIFKKPCTLSLEKTAEALSNCKWPGRTQILYGSCMTFYLDGAHTIESIAICCLWFKNATCHTYGKRFLIFNLTGDRDAVCLLRSLKTLNFDRTYFVPNIAGSNSTIDQENYSVPVEQQIIKCHKYCEIWGPNSIVMNNVSEALNHAKEESRLEHNFTPEYKTQVLVTGSLHLIGATLACLDPNLTMTTNF